MKIQITFENEEREKVKTIANMIGAKLHNRIDGDWGIFKSGMINITPQCFIDACDITIALIPKFKSLINFMKALFPITETAFIEFKKKWIDVPVMTEADLESLAKKNKEFNKEVNKVIDPVIEPNKVLKSENKEKMKASTMINKENDKAAKSKS